MEQETPDWARRHQSPRSADTAVRAQLQHASGLCLILTACAYWCLKAHIDQSLKPVFNCKGLCSAPLSIREERETHGPPRSSGRVDFFRVAGTISEGRFRYSRRNSMPSSLKNLQQHMHGSTDDAGKGEDKCSAPGTSMQPFHKSWGAYATWRVVGQHKLRRPIFIRNQGAGQEAPVGQMSSQPMHAAAEYQHVAKIEGRSSDIHCCPRELGCKGRRSPCG